MTEKRKLAAILAADVVGYSRLAGADEERTLARLRALRSDLIDPTIALHHGRVVKRTGDGVLIEFRSVVDAVRCAIEMQNGMVERNAGLPAERRIEFRIGIHVGDVVEESDGDLMGDGVNIAARLEGIADPSGICLSEDAYRQVRDRLKEGFIDLGEKDLKNIARPVRLYAIKAGTAGAVSETDAPTPHKPGPPRLSIVVLPFANLGGDPEQEYFVDGVTESLTTDLSRLSGSFVIGRNTAFTYKGKHVALKQIGRELNVRYVLEGSVQRSSNRLRVNVQLIDAETGAHLWAERFDKPLADLFDMQDEIVARLANALSPQLTAAEAYSGMPSFSSQCASCCVAELRCGTLLGFSCSALRGRALAGLPPALEGFFTASASGWERGIVARRESTGHGASTLRRGSLNGAIFLGAIPRRRTPRGHQGNPGCRVAARAVHWKNLSCVPAEVPERAAN